MNIFGGATGSAMDEGPRGPRGFRGKDSTMDDFSLWLPRTFVNNLQVNEEKGAFFVIDPEKDLVHKNDEKAITQWVSRSRRGGNLVAVKPASGELEKIHVSEYDDEERYAIKFKNAQYKCRASFLTGFKETCGYICITFRTYSEDDQVLISANKRYQQQQVTEVRISGATEITIQFDNVKEIVQHSSLKEWTTLFIGYNSDSKLVHFTYDVNGTSSGSFTAPSRGHVRGGFCLGSSWEGAKFLDGDIASLEVYENDKTAAPLPETLKNMIIENQKVIY